MAVKVAVVTGAVPTDSTPTTFTSTGFGDVEAAIIIVARTTSAGSSDHAVVGYGFWDYNGGTPVHSTVAGRSEHGSANGDTSRGMRDDAIGIIDPASDAYEQTYSFSRTTNGLQATIGSGTGAAYKCTVVLFNGLASHKVGSTELNGTTAVTVSTGFKPTAIFSCFSASTPGSTVSSSNVEFSVGVAHHAAADSGTPSKIGAISYAAAEGAVGIVNTTINDDCIARRYLANGTGGAQEILVQNVGATSFEFVVSDAHSSYIGWLAIELEDPDQFYLGFGDAATGTGDDTTFNSIGFEPIAVGQFNVRESTLNNLPSSPTAAMSIGFASPSSAASYIIADQDGSGTMDTSSRHDATNFLTFYDHDDAVDALATVTTWGSNGVTLNWNDAAAAAYKYLFWAIGADTGGGAVSVSPTKFTNTSTFGSHVLSVGSVSLTPTKYSNTSTFGSHSLSQTGAEQSLTATKFANTSTFGSHSIATGAVSLSPTKFSNTSVFGSHVLTSGFALTHTKFTNTSTFGNHVISVGAVNLTPTKFTNTSIFGSHILTAEGGPQTLIPTKITNTSVFGSHALSVGSVTLTQTKFSNVSAFGSHDLGLILNATKFSNTSSFGTQVVAGGTVTLNVTKFTNTSTFGTHVVVGGEIPTFSSGGGGGIRTVPLGHDYTMMILMVDTNGDGVTGLTLDFTASKAGGAFEDIIPSVTERGDGWYAVTLDAADLDTEGEFVLTVEGTGAETQAIVSQIALSTQDAVSAALTSARLLTLGQFLALK